jgi:hypothetical protein
MTKEEKRKKLQEKVRKYLHKMKAPDLPKIVDENPEYTKDLKKYGKDAAERRNKYRDVVRTQEMEADFRREKADKYYSDRDKMREEETKKKPKDSKVFGMRSRLRTAGDALRKKKKS